MVSSTSAAYNLTVNNSASGSYALKVMTIVTVIFLPVVLAYQGWSFYVFRARVMAPPAPGSPAPSAGTPAPPPGSPGPPSGPSASPPLGGSRPQTPAVDA